MKKFTYVLGSALIVIGVLVMAILDTTVAVVSGLSLVLAGIGYLIFGAILERQERLIEAVKALDFDPIDKWARRYGRRLAVDAALVTGSGDKPVKAWFATDNDWHVEPDDNGGYRLHGRITMQYPEYAQMKNVHAMLNFDPRGYRSIDGWSIADIRFSEIRS